MAVIGAYDTQRQRDILESAKVIAVVGYSDDPRRTSNQIGRYLKNAGYKVYAVNPTVQQVDGEQSYPTLADVPEPIDIVNVFRRPEFLSGVVDDAIGVGAKVVWAQLGISNQEAARKAAAAGIDIIMNNCIKVTYGALMR